MDLVGMRLPWLVLAASCMCSAVAGVVSRDDSSRTLAEV
jgi:hypothetical protein